MTTRPDPRVGTTFGSYHILSVLGRGGMGVVYLAEHRDLGRKVALKLLASDVADDAGFRARFLRESRMAAAIDHPNIIPIYEAGEVDGNYFLAMRYVDGVDLTARLRDGVLSPADTARLLAQVAAALDAAHAAGLVHRDVKPANLLIASGQGVDRVDHVYLTDFGLTKQRGSETGLTRSGSFLGTLEYISPEQIEGKPVDGRADQYALAAIAVECLTGQAPYPRDSEVAILNAHLRAVAPSVTERRPELPRPVDAVVARGLAKKPEDRYPDCQAFVDELRRALGIAITQPRVRPAGPARSRSALMAGIALVAVVVLAAGLVLLGSRPPGATVAPGSVPVVVASIGGPGSSGTAPASGTPGDARSDAEGTLLRALKYLPKTTVGACVSGPYVAIANIDPQASLRCSLDGTAGANELIVRLFRPPNAGSAHGADAYAVDDMVTVIASKVADGDCATSTRAKGRWDGVGGIDAGAVACFMNGQTGDAILWWSYRDDQILIQATNQKGDSKALYQYFLNTRAFIAP